MDVVKLLQNQEEFRQFMYDDATGKEWKPGMPIEGSPTVGYGFNIGPNGEGLNEFVSTWVLRYKIEKITHRLISRLQWFISLDLVRQAALVSAAYNLGFDGLMEFHNALGAMSMNDWVGANREFKDSKWYRNPLTQHRAESIANMVLTGKW